MKHILLCTFCVTSLLVLAGCNRSDGTPGAVGASGNVATPLETPVTVDVAQTVPTCSEATHGGGQFLPVTLPENLGFGWTPVTKPAATRYAAQLGRHQAGSTAPAILASRTVKAGDKLEVMAGERTLGNSYRAKVVAYDDKGPICVVGGVNGLSPMPN